MIHIRTDRESARPSDSSNVQFSHQEALLNVFEDNEAVDVYVYDIKLDGKKQNIDPMWKVLNKEVHLGELTSFLDHVYLGCTQ